MTAHLQAIVVRYNDASEELNAARTEFEADANDLTAEWVRDAEFRYLTALAIAQEWCVPDCPGQEAWA